MSDDCIDTNHFANTSQGLVPQVWMQHRRVAGGSVPTTSVSYPVSGGVAKDALIHTVNAQWTNSSPIPQRVYGLVTRGGCRVTLQSRSRAYLQMFHAAGVGSLGSLVQVSKVGIGTALGKAGLFSNNAFGVSEIRQNAVTLPLLPRQSGMTQLAAGQTFMAQVTLRFKSDFWENSVIDGGGGATESGFDSGETRIDLFAIPYLA